MYKKRVTSFLLAVMLLFMPLMEVSAEESNEKSEESEEEEIIEEVITVEDANETLESYSDEETEWEEIYIDSVEDLKAFSRNCWLDTWSWNKKVYLTEDLDLTGSGFVSIPTFGGYFDGQGHTIKGLSIRDAVSYTGLFCYTQRTAVIANLNVQGSVRPSGKQMVVGGIVGDNSGIIINCNFDGLIEGNDYVGGITGFNEISGILIDCTNNSKITGAHYTGGIAGDNMGNIVGCVNEADVNISNADKEKSLEDINLEQYSFGFMDNGDNSEQNEKQAAINNNTIDSGGIAGLSTGIIQFCVNKGTIGYEHVGYNIGGIVGRQSGYVYACENTGTVYGRKDVGGIAGQTEPYIAIDLTKDIVYQLSENIDEMHDLTALMLKDAGAESDTITSRLSVIQDFASKALDDTSYLADRTVEWTDGMIGSVNDAIDRLDYVMDEAAKENGMVDQTRYAADNVKEAAYELEDTVEALDIYQYMSPADRERYDNAKAGIESAGREYAGYYDDAMRGYHNCYVNKAWQTEGSDVDDLRPMVDGSVKVDLIKSDDFEDFIPVNEWVHCDDSGVPIDEFPSSDPSRSAADHAVLNKAAELMAADSETVAKGASKYAEKMYPSYSTDVKKNLETMSDIVLQYQAEMTESAVAELKDAVGYAKDASGNLAAAGDEAKNIADTLNGMPDIEMPLLGDNYRTKTNSLTSNLQGLSENMGYLNDEMSSNNDVLIGDLENLNDQFSTIMRLYMDAIDGVLDMDYSNIYEDNSEEDAETSTDATIADCKNSGMVRGDINVSGIAGTMAIEYDFDLESDVTGIEDARMNSTFLTKCVLRKNVNSGKITAQKSYAGGISGLQEMGTILWCENYGKIISSTGSYVGGITGQSRSHIMDSYAKCSVSGEEYVAGIAGYGSSIRNCCAMVRIQDAAAFSGAIAGTTDGNGTIENNFFVSDEIAGIDRISYSGKAEPVSYQEMLEIEGLPRKFGMMTIAFYADEEEVKTVECRYGGAVPETMYPEIPVKQGFYADWDIKELRNVVHDEDVTVEYVRYLTTIASAQTRENAQSVFLADGMFKKEAVLELTMLDVPGIMLEDAAEHWMISCSDDGSSEHQIRYQAPKGQTEGVSIYVRNGDEWIRMDTELMGIYHLFTIEGADAEIAVCVHEKGIMDYLVYIIVGAIVLIIVIILVVMKVRKKKAVKQEAEEKAEEETE